MRFHLVFLLALVACAAQAQSTALREMVDAEKAFIEMARTQNRRDAFLYYLSDSVITQGPDGPVKGKERIAAQPITDDWLSWEISYSDMASSGDFGFNTGPWYYRAKKSDAKPSAYGQFNSIWKKQPDGSWKNVLDIGIGHPDAGPPVSSRESQIRSFPSRTSAGMNQVLEVERNFLNQLGQLKLAAYPENLSSEVRLMMSGSLPQIGRDNAVSFIRQYPSVSNTTVLGGETARSGDMGYVYGTAEVTLEAGAKSETRRATYVRIWKREASAWKIVLDVLSF